MNEHVDYKLPEKHYNNKFVKFLWWCSGADEQILIRSTLSDSVKYQGLGGIVVATGILASLSMFFAINYVFNNLAISLAIGLLWGAIIFNLDRFIVSSTGKGDGKENISWREFGNAIPRLFMAIVLGITISAPLEVFIFKTEIEKEFRKRDSAEQKIEIKKIEKLQTESPEFIRLNADKTKYEAAIIAKENERKERQDDAARENSTEKGGCGPKCKKYEKMAEEVQIQIDSLKSQVSRINQKLNVFEQDKNKQIAELSSTNTSGYGLLDRIVTLEAIEGANVPTWFLRLMFIFIEIAPVLLKLQIIKGPSDYMNDNVGQILESKQGIDIEHIADEKDKITKQRIHHNPRRINDIIKHQNLKESENAKKAIDEYAEKERKEIEQNPDNFIKS